MIEQSKPTCPGCNHPLDDDQMIDSGQDLFAISPNEETVEIECPSCFTIYWCRGGYTPHYLSSISLDGEYDE